MGVVGKFDSEVSVESSAHEREGPGCCRDSIMVNLLKVLAAKEVDRWVSGEAA